MTDSRASSPQGNSKAKDEAKSLIQEALAKQQAMSLGQQPVIAQSTAAYYQPPVQVDFRSQLKGKSPTGNPSEAKAKAKPSITQMGKPVIVQAPAPKPKAALPALFAQALAGSVDYISLIREGSDRAFLDTLTKNIKVRPKLIEETNEAKETIIHKMMCGMMRQEKRLPFLRELLIQASRDSKFLLNHKVDGNDLVGYALKNRAFDCLPLLSEIYPDFSARLLSYMTANNDPKALAGIIQQGFVKSATELKNYILLAQKYFEKEFSPLSLQFDEKQDSSVVLPEALQALVSGFQMQQSIIDESIQAMRDLRKERFSFLSKFKDLSIELGDVADVYNVDADEIIIPLRKSANTIVNWLETIEKMFQLCGLRSPNQLRQPMQPSLQKYALSPHIAYINGGHYSTPPLHMLKRKSFAIDAKLRNDLEHALKLELAVSTTLETPHRQKELVRDSKEMAAGSQSVEVITPKPVMTAAPVEKNTKLVTPPVSPSNKGDSKGGEVAPAPVAKAKLKPLGLKLIQVSYEHLIMYMSQICSLVNDIKSENDPDLARTKQFMLMQMSGNFAFLNMCREKDKHKLDAATVGMMLEQVSNLVTDQVNGFLQGVKANTAAVNKFGLFFAANQNKPWEYDSNEKRISRKGVKK